MIDISKKGDVFTIKFTRNDVSDEFIDKLLTKFKLEELLKKSRLTEKQAWELSEEIKENWWRQNKDWILKKAGISNIESNS
ncbi:hypothetical protein GWN91_02220 [Candidatus Saccharibacteria bacterium]|nr:hypothetical protein [Candidatus Saccharibacteria bacterium]NIV72575.1 hypothetical protein [Calditrichia bacterium]NIW78585.1 hypothetical protein [Calditrichia bacterium]